MRGYTLIELLVVLALAALLAGLAVPGWAAVSARLRLTVGTSTVLSALSRARLAALTSGETVLLQPVEGGTRFAVFARGEHGMTLLQQGDLPRGLRLSANRAAVEYYPWPRAASPVTLTLCAAPVARLVVVSQSGRPRVETRATC
jgi:type IV fimbrial biogenesis protein FimT